MDARGPRLRVVCVNDVYSLENLPRLKTLVDHERTTNPADVLLVTLAGDFLAPSMLSSLDAGRGMVECLNAVPVTHVVLGNHEDDVPYAALCSRLDELSATCLGTNVHGLAAALPEVDVIDVVSPTGQRVHVGLVGVVMTDPAIYRAAPFGGAKLASANETALRVARELAASGRCDAVVTMTHQDMKDDRELAKELGGGRFPLIVGGHEHEPFLETLHGVTIVKAGSDATLAFVVDLEWPLEAGLGVPTVETRRLEVAAFSEDASLRTLVDRHMRQVHALEGATLRKLEPGQTLSSIGARRSQTSVGTLLCSMLRSRMGADAAVLNGGAVRASREYLDQFTYADLRSEVPFDNEIVVVSMPGSVLADAIAASRAQAPLDSGGFLQVDDGTRVGADHRLERVANEPFDPKRDYRVALVRNFFAGMDHIEPLIRFAEREPSRIPPEHSGRELKVVLVEAFAVSLLSRLGSFDAIDASHDGVVQRGEVAEALARLTHEAASNITVDLVMRAIDADHDGALERGEVEGSEGRRPLASEPSNQ